MDGGELSIRLTIIECLARGCRESMAQSAILEEDAKKPSVIQLVGGHEQNRQAAVKARYDQLQLAAQQQLRSLVEHGSALKEVLTQQPEEVK